jgi:hypothetical protein
MSNPTEPTQALSNKAKRRKIQQDQDIIEMLDKVKLVKISDKLESEIRQYFITSRDLATGRFSHRGVSSSFSNPRKNMEKIAEVILEIQAYRDRLIGIQLGLLTHLHSIQTALRVSKELIQERYSNYVKSFGSLTQQELFVNHVLEKLLEKQEYITSMTKNIELILKNLDNAYFAYLGVRQIGDSVISRSEGGQHSHVRI